MELVKDGKKEEGGEADGVKGEWREEPTLSVSKIYPVPSAPKENITVLGCQAEMDDRDTCAA